MGNLNHLWWTDAEEDGGRCRKHPSWQQALQGVCPACLRQRLLQLCPDCATMKPCPCSVAASSSLSTTASLSILLSLDPAAEPASSEPGRKAPIGAVGRVGNLIECEPAFRRSRSAALGLARTRSDEKRINTGWRLPSWLSIKPNSKTKTEAAEGDPALVNDIYVDDEKTMRAEKLCRSKSVGYEAFPFQPQKQQQQHQLPVCSVPIRPRLSTATKEAVSGELKRKGWYRWYFPSPMKAFGQRSRSGAATGGSVLQQQRSPICRG